MITRGNFRKANQLTKFPRFNYAIVIYHLLSSVYYEPKVTACTSCVRSHLDFLHYLFNEAQTLKGSIDILFRPSAC